MLDLASFLTLAPACAPEVSPLTLAAVVQVESGFEPLAIGINRPRRVALKPGSPGEAAVAARRLIAAGADVDLGLGQINQRNLDWLGLTVEQAFEPCRNLAAAGAVLRDGLRRAAPRVGQAALRTALSYYNTGHPLRGERNGYVARVVRAAAAFTGQPWAASLAGAVSKPAPAPTPSWTVFDQPDAPAGPAFVLSFNSGDRP